MSPGSQPWSGDKSLGHRRASWADEGPSMQAPLGVGGERTGWALWGKSMRESSLLCSDTRRNLLGRLTRP